MGGTNAALVVVPPRLHDHHRDRDLGERLHGKRCALGRVRGDADSGGEVGSVGAVIGYRLRRCPRVHPSAAKYRRCQFVQRRNILGFGSELFRRSEGRAHSHSLPLRRESIRPRLWS